jgi:branched-subunit amino acid ABC-type transport system permease component
MNGIFLQLVLNALIASAMYALVASGLSFIRPQV